MLEGSDEIFDVSVVDFIDIVKYDVGQEVTIEYKQGEKANTVMSLTEGKAAADTKTEE